MLLERPTPRLFGRGKRGTRRCSGLSIVITLEALLVIACQAPADDSFHVPAMTQGSAGTGASSGVNSSMTFTASTANTAGVPQVNGEPTASVASEPSAGVTTGNPGNGNNPDGIVGAGTVGAGTTPNPSGAFGVDSGADDGAVDDTAADNSAEPNDGGTSSNDARVPMGGAIGLSDASGTDDVVRCDGVTLTPGAHNRTLDVGGRMRTFILCLSHAAAYTPATVTLDFEVLSETNLLGEHVAGDSALVSHGSERHTEKPETEHNQEETGQVCVVRALPTRHSIELRVRPVATLGPDCHARDIAFSTADRVESARNQTGSRPSDSECNAGRDGPECSASHHDAEEGED